MRYLFCTLLLFYFYHASGQQLKETDLLGTWTTSHFKYSKWIFHEIRDVEFEPKLIRRGYPVDFFYFLDSAENELEISQLYGEGYDTSFLFKIIYHDQKSIVLNYYKKIQYSRKAEQTQKEIIIPNGGTTIILRKKIANLARQN